MVSRDRSTDLCVSPEVRALAAQAQTQAAYRQGVAEYLALLREAGHSGLMDTRTVRALLAYTRQGTLGPEAEPDTLEAMTLFTHLRVALHEASHLAAIHLFTLQGVCRVQRIEMLPPAPASPDVTGFSPVSASVHLSWHLAWQATPLTSRLNICHAPELTDPLVAAFTVAGQLHASGPRRGMSHQDQEKVQDLLDGERVHQQDNGTRWTDEAWRRQAETLTDSAMAALHDWSAVMTHLTRHAAVPLVDALWEAQPTVDPEVIDLLFSRLAERGCALDYEEPSGKFVVGRAPASPADLCPDIASLFLCAGDV